MEGPFSFETLSKQDAVERKSPRLTKIEAKFFAELRTYLELLEVSHRREQEKNPASKKVQFLADELRNARRKAEALWESRERKIVQYALKSSRGEPTAVSVPENLTREEQPFYETLLLACRDQQQRMLPSMGPVVESPTLSRPVIHAMTQGSVSASGPSPSVPPPPPLPTPPTVTSLVAPQVPAGSSDELQTIRALVDIPPFVGFDGKTYRIKKGEVLSLPKRFAKILKDRGQVAVVA